MGSGVAGHHGGGGGAMLWALGTSASGWEEDDKRLLFPSRSFLVLTGTSVAETNGQDPQLRQGTVPEI